MYLPGTVCNKTAVIRAQNCGEGGLFSSVQRAQVPSVCSLLEVAAGQPEPSPPVARGEELSPERRGAAAAARVVAHLPTKEGFKES